MGRLSGFAWARTHIRVSPSIGLFWPDSLWGQKFFLFLSASRTLPGSVHRASSAPLSIAEIIQRRVIELVVNCKGCGRKGSWPVSDCVPAYPLQRLRKASNDLSQDSRSFGRDLSLGSPSYETVLPLDADVLSPSSHAVGTGAFSVG